MSVTPVDEQTKLKAWSIALKCFLNEYGELICKGDCINCNFWRYDQTCQLDGLTIALEWLIDGMEEIHDSHD